MPATSRHRHNLNLITINNPLMNYRPQSKWIDLIYANLFGNLFRKTFATLCFNTLYLSHDIINRGSNSHYQGR